VTSVEDRLIHRSVGGVSRDFVRPTE